MRLLDSHPEPEIYDDDLQLTYLFGGVKFVSNPSNYNRVLHDVARIIEDIAPLADQVYRVDLSSWNELDKVISAISPVSPRKRSPLTKKLRSHDQFYSVFETLKAYILKGMMNGRHSAFALQPEKQLLLYLHHLNKSMNPSFPMFLGDLKVKILNLATYSGNLHVISHAKQITVTGVVKQSSVAHEDSSNNYTYM